MHISGHCRSFLVILTPTRSSVVGSVFYPFLEWNLRLCCSRGSCWGWRLGGWRRLALFPLLFLGDIRKICWQIFFEHLGCRLLSNDLLKIYQKKTNDVSKKGENLEIKKLKWKLKQNKEGQFICKLVIALLQRYDRMCNTTSAYGIKESERFNNFFFNICRSYKYIHQRGSLKGTRTYLSCYFSNHNWK